MAGVFTPPARRRLGGSCGVWATKGREPSAVTAPRGSGRERTRPGRFAVASVSAVEMGDSCSRVGARPALPVGAALGGGVPFSPRARDANRALGTRAVGGSLDRGRGAERGLRAAGRGGLRGEVENPRGAGRGRIRLAYRSPSHRGSTRGGAVRGVEPRAGRERRVAVIVPVLRETALPCPWRGPSRPTWGRAAACRRIACRRIACRHSARHHSARHHSADPGLAAAERAEVGRSDREVALERAPLGASIFRAGPEAIGSGRAIRARPADPWAVRFSGVDPRAVLDAAHVTRQRQMGGGAELTPQKQQGQAPSAHQMSVRAGAARELGRASSGCAGHLHHTSHLPPPLTGINEAVESRKRPAPPCADAEGARAIGPVACGGGRAGPSSAAGNRTRGPPRAPSPLARGCCTTGAFRQRAWSAASTARRALPRRQRQSGGLPGPTRDEVEKGRTGPGPHPRFSRAVRLGARWRRGLRARPRPTGGDPAARFVRVPIAARDPNPACSLGLTRPPHPGSLFGERVERSLPALVVLPDHVGVTTTWAAGRPALADPLVLALFAGHALVRKVAIHEGFPYHVQGPTRKRDLPRRSALS